MFGLFLFFFQFGVLWLIWWLTTNHTRRDFVFFVFGLIFATSICNFFGSVWMVRMRHLIIPFSLVAVYFRWRLLRENMGSLAKIYLLLTLLVFVASLWSSDPYGFFCLKWKRTLNNICVILMAATFRTGDDLKKVLFAALPQIALLGFGLQVGSQEFGMTDGRLVVNEVNSNGVGAMGGFVVLEALFAILYLRIRLGWKVLFGFCLLVGLRALVASGSRTAFASCAGASFIALAVVFTTARRFWLIGVPTLLASAGGFCYIWNRASVSVIERLSGLATGGVSGRDMVWEMALNHLLSSRLWCGAGGIVQGSFITRLDFDLTGLRWGSVLNMYFDTIYETGILGLCLWALFFICFGWLIIRIWRSGTSPLRYVPMAMCFWGLLQGCGESMPLNGFHPTGTLMIVGLTVLSAKKFCYEDFNVWKFVGRGEKIVWS